MLLYQFTAHHAELFLNSKIKRVIFIKQLTLVSQIFIIDLRVDSHQDCQSLIHHTIVYLSKEHQLTESNEVFMQVLCDLSRVEWLEENLYCRSEASYECVKFITCLGRHRVLNIFLLPIILKLHFFAITLLSDIQISRLRLSSIQE